MNYRSLLLCFGLCFSLGLSQTASSQIRLDGLENVKLPKRKKNKKGQETQEETQTQNNNGTSKASSLAKTPKAKEETPKGPKVQALGHFKPEDIKEDPYGLSGIYYVKDQKDGTIYTAKLQVSFCTDKTKIKGATHLLECMEVNTTYAYERRSKEVETFTGRGYGDYLFVALLEEQKTAVFSGRHGGSLMQVAPGVFIETPDNYKDGVFDTNKDALEKYDWAYLMSSGRILAKNLEDLETWNDKEKVKTTLTNTSEQYRTIVSSLENAKKAAVDMPALGSLNSKALQTQALKAYNERYNAVNKDWTHHYVYVHGKDWRVLTQKHTGKTLGREVAVVIARTSPKGECRADLMNFVEPFEDGAYQPSKGYISGAISYIGMPGGALPCEKIEQFKAKLAK